MKKSLLLAAGIVAAMSASAQTPEYCAIDPALNLGDEPNLEAMQTIAKTADGNVEMKVVAAQAYNSQDPRTDGFKTMIVNGESIALQSGIGAPANNPKANLDDYITEVGTTYYFSVKKDGYIIVPSKISSNKNYYVFAGGNEINTIVGAAAYTLYAHYNDKYFTTPEGTTNVIEYTLPAGEYALLDRTAADIDKYTFGSNVIEWPERIITGNVESALKKNGTGCLVFKAYADAQGYYVLATGSKMNKGGFIYIPCDLSTTPLPTIAISAEDYNNTGSPLTYTFGGGDSAIDSIIADAEENENAPMYNVLGQQVNESYKGLVIKNGKKFINR